MNEADRLILERKARGQCVFCGRQLRDGDPKRILTHDVAGQVKACPEHHGVEQGS